MNIYPEAIAKGIRLHREIDYFADNHPIVMKSKSKMRDSHGHYAGVVIDVFYDHFLAKNWRLYNQKTLHNFVKNIYSKLSLHRTIFPPPAKEVLAYMIKDDWLNSYTTIKGVDIACRGIARRTKFFSNMENASKSLEKHYGVLEQEFTQFFPLLIEHCENFLENKS